MAWFIGLMSGTSLDGVDGVLAETQETGPPLRTCAHVHAPLPRPLRTELLALNTAGQDELHRAALAANGLAAEYDLVVCALLSGAGLAPAQITAIGAHGQTVRHRPGADRHGGYTIQLLNGALLAERTGIDVACDFRSRDVAAGGQGAPLVPGFHAACFAVPGRSRAVLNLGGIANLTLLRAEGAVLGFDTGPANLLLDGWCQQHLGAAYDEGGAWAAGGRVDETLLSSLLAEPFFALPPPKSTGRDLFGPAWLAPRLAGSTASPQDIMATLAELTARSAAQALLLHAADTSELFVCGGGAANAHLMRRLQVALPRVAVDSTSALGVAADQMEALAFAWLAQALVMRAPGNLPAVTGAAGPRVLGAIYPAS